MPNWQRKLSLIHISHQEADVTLEVPGRENSPLKREEVGDVKRAWTGKMCIRDRFNVL